MKRAFDFVLMILWTIAGLINLGAVIFTKWEPFTLLNAVVVFLAVINVREHYKNWRAA